MSASRTLKLNILAETKDLVDGLKKADTATQTAASKIADGFKKVGVAVAAAGVAAAAYAAKLAVDGVKAAIEDEAAQVRLANALRNTTGATNEQIAALERQILNTSLATGVADDQLRPAFQRLATATGDITKSQDLLNTALNISAATGKPLEAVTNALGRAYEGSTTSLGRLGIGLGAADIKALGLEGTMAALNEKFGGAAQAQAETFEGKVARLRVAFDEAKETVGAALLPALTELFDLVTGKIVPIFQRLSDDFSKNVGPVLERVWKLVKENLFPVLQVLGNFIFNDLVPTIRDFFKPVIDIIITGITFLIGKIKENSDGFSVFLGIIDRVWQFLKTYVIPLFQTALVTAINIVFRNIGTLIDAFSTVFEIIGKIARFLGFDLDFALNKATGSINKQTSATADAYRQFQSYSTQVTQEVIPATNAFAGAQNAVAVSTAKTTAAIKEQSKATDALAKLKQKIGKDLTGEATVQAAKDARSAAAQAAAGKAVDRLNDVFDATFDQLIAAGRATGIGGASLGTTGFLNFTAQQAVAAGLGGVSQRDLARSLSAVGMGAGYGGGVTINVNGQLLDPEGVARAIQDVLQNSSARGGAISLGAPIGVE